MNLNTQVGQPKGSNMKISMIDLHGQYATIKSEIADAIMKVVDRQDFVLGKELEAMETEIARYCDTKYAVGVASGTDALLLSLRSIDIKPGDEVITTPFTFFATAEAISLLGAKPVFVDIDPRTYNIDPTLIEKKITKATKAIIPVHLYGQCADMDPILDIAKKHGLKVLEDNAQAIGASYKGRRSGSMGDLGSISLYPGKNLGAYGEGGVIVTNDKTLADKVKILRNHGSHARYMHSEIGYNSRLDNLQAAVILVKMRYLDKWLDTRRNIAAYYNEQLKGLPITLPFTPEYNIHTWHLYVAKVNSGLNDLMKYLVENGIETRTYYPVPLHMQECYTCLGYKKGDLKQSEEAASTTFALPVYPELSKNEIDHVVKVLKQYFGK